MGYVAEPTPRMGEYSVEVRRESFYLRGDLHAHRVFIYPWGEEGDGTVEFLTADIPKIRAALDQVERHVAGGPDEEPAPPPAAEPRGER